MYLEQFVDDKDSGCDLVVRDKDGSEVTIPVGGNDGEAIDAANTLVKRNLILHERSSERLDSLRLRTGATSDSELVRYALKFYETLVDYELDGKRIVTKKPAFVGNQAEVQETTYFIPVSRPRSRLTTGWIAQAVASLRNRSGDHGGVGKE